MIRSNLLISTISVFLITYLIFPIHQLRRSTTEMRRGTRSTYLRIASLRVFSIWTSPAFGLLVGRCGI